MSPEEQAVHAVLDRLAIPFARHEHPPVFTVEQALAHWAAIDATHCKNLFLRNKKGDRHYLVVARHDSPIDLASLGTTMGEGRLSFASAERLARCLGLTPGAVSPFGLINDRERAVQVWLDGGVRTALRVGFHPNVNTATLVLAGRDFLAFLAWCRNPVRDFSP